MHQVLATVDFFKMYLATYLLSSTGLFITADSYASRQPYKNSWLLSPIQSSNWLPRALPQRRSHSVTTRGSVRATFLSRNRRGSASRFHTWHSELENNKTKHLSTPFIHTQSLLSFSPVYTSSYSPIPTARFLTMSWLLRPTPWELEGHTQADGWMDFFLPNYVSNLRDNSTANSSVLSYPFPNVLFSVFIACPWKCPNTSLF